MGKSCHSRPPASALPELASRLRAGSRKVTGQRQAILDAMQKHQRPMTNREIHACLGAEECNLATIYRSMHLLERMGIVTKHHFGDGVSRYELVTPSRDGHHHHLVCVKCSEVVEIEECFPREIERQIAEQNGFKNITHSLEFFGVCPACQT